MNKRHSTFFTLRLSTFFTALVVVVRQVSSIEKFDCYSKTTTTPKLFVDDFDCRFYFRCVINAADQIDASENSATVVVAQHQIVQRFKCRPGFVFDPCRLKCLWSEECLPKSDGCDYVDVSNDIRNDEPLPPSNDDSVGNATIATTVSKSSDRFSDRTHSGNEVDNVTPTFTVLPDGNLTTYYVVRVIFKGNFSADLAPNPSVDLGENGATTPINSTNDTSSPSLALKAAPAFPNGTFFDEASAPDQVLSNFTVINSSQDQLTTNQVSLGAGDDMAKDEAMNSTIRTIIVDCDRQNAEICGNFHNRPLISRRESDDYDNGVDEVESSAQLVHPCSDSVTCENGGMFLSMSDGRCGCLCPIGYRGPLCQRLVSPFQCGCLHGGQCVRILEQSKTFEPGANISDSKESIYDEEDKVSYVCSCPQGVIGPKCQYVLPPVPKSKELPQGAGRRRTKTWDKDTPDGARTWGCECLNGGTCLIKKYGYVCLCPDNFTGRRCQINDSKRRRH